MSSYSFNYLKGCEIHVIKTAFIGVACFKLPLTAFYSEYKAIEQTLMILRIVWCEPIDWNDLQQFKGVRAHIFNQWLGNEYYVTSAND